LRTLLIDNHDSFTYNLFQLLAEENGEEPIVVRNDEASWEELAGLGFDNLVVSPGPGRPERETDFGVCAEAIRRCEVPVLGVCLGHQGLAFAHGGTIVEAPEAVHGRPRAVVHDGSRLFAGIPREFEAIAYHSLCVAQPLPGALRPLAWSDDGVLMAVRHRRRPQWGVQFHPESICTEHGRRLLANFRDLTAAAGSRPAPPPRRRKPPRPAAPPPPSLELRVERLDLAVDPERAFVELYGDSEAAFWLDGGGGPVDGWARFSFIGDAAGPLAAAISYDVEAGEVRVERGGRTERRRESIFAFLDAELRRLRPPGQALPFEFDCGFAGYFGYELKAECGGRGAHRSPLPDAAFVLADRVLAIDRAAAVTYLLCLHEPGGEEEADGWLAATRRRLVSLPAPPPVAPAGAARFRFSRDRERYLEDIAACKRRLRAGDSYEICLTNKASAPCAADPLDLYRRLRRVNPAPYAAYLRLGDVAVLSSSPERFLRIGRDRRVEARPIKGTSRRGRGVAEDLDLAERLRRDGKSRAENLMIADLLRHDLGSVCEVGTVRVPELMRVETYETVHHLVSAVRGRLREGVGPAECVRACFPPGSMTGAPKERTMEILDELEGEARGVYSGALGFLGLGGGCDLAVTIRTIVLDGRSATLGAGGAIVVQSDPEEELGEVLLKASAPMRAVDPQADPAAALAATAAPSRSPRAAV
jgi:para-aminobenzoate synthetase